jgi:hypothetical protein
VAISWKFGWFIFELEGKPTKFRQNRWLEKLVGVVWEFS